MAPLKHGCAPRRCRRRWRPSVARPPCAPPSPAARRAAAGRSPRRRACTSTRLMCLRDVAGEAQQRTPARAPPRPAITPPTVRAEWISDSSGMAMKASANGRMKPSSIWPAVGMRPTQPSVGAACTVASDCSSACLSAISMSRISASAASTPASVTSSAQRDPHHAPAHAVVQVLDARKQMRDAHRLHQEQAHRRLDEDDHQRRHLGGAQRGRDVVAGARPSPTSAARSACS